MTEISIEFYRANEQPFGVFSNLYKCEIAFNGRIFPTAEHAYQYGKPAKENVRNWLMLAPTPAILATTAHALLPWDVTPNWSKVKVGRMHDVLLAKFTQHELLLDLLLRTGDTPLIERGTVNNAVNRYWGIVNGRGENMLGKLLMQVRTELRSSREGAA